MSDKMNDSDLSFANITKLSRFIGVNARRPLYLTLLAFAILIVAAWYFLITSSILAIDASPQGNLGPGADLIRGWFDADLSPTILRILDICLTPIDGAQTGASFSTLSLFLILWLMWGAMSFAMMFPSAAPLIKTYVEISDTAALKQEKVQPVIVLVAGYLAIWFGAAALYALLHLTLLYFTNSVAAVPIQGVSSGVILIIAGLYQFSAIKNACLVKCQNPFSTLFGNWQTSFSGVFKLGLDQGVFCLGCCWALMLVMLSVGTMNIIWMVAFTLLALFEKTGRGIMTSRFIGAILVIWGIMLVLLSVF